MRPDLVSLQLFARAVVARNLHVAPEPPERTERQKAMVQSTFGTAFLGKGAGGWVVQ